MPAPSPPLTPLHRLVLAFYAFFAVLFRAEVAEQVSRVREARRARALPPAVPGGGEAAGSRPPLALRERGDGAAAPEAPAPARAEPAPRTDPRGALQLLSVLQREGRLVDFLEEDLAGFPDAAVGAAARTVHEGCKRALSELVELEPVMREAEGAQVTVQPGFDPAAVRLTGNVVGAPPFRGALRHHGWRAREVKLPAVADGASPSILAPAEVEL